VHNEKFTNNNQERTWLQNAGKDVQMFSATNAKIVFSCFFYTRLYFWTAARRQNFFRLRKSTFSDDKVTVLKLSIQDLFQKNTPLKVTPFWNSIK
jgi:hypothetical protein